ncbi:MAG: peptidylprolyl isomerase, partial [Flavobacteriales bacterium]|nr:peptidylprolyl isomerase [Flavobacteriales bacterium]
EWARSVVDTTADRMLRSSTYDALSSRRVLQDSSIVRYLLREGSGYERVRAADALRRWPATALGSMETELSSMINMEQELEVKAFLLGAMRHSSEDIQRNVLNCALDQEHPLVQLAMLRLMGARSDTTYLSALLERARKGDPHVAMVAMEQLEALDTIPAGYLIQAIAGSDGPHLPLWHGLMLRHGDPTIVRSSLEELQRMHAREQDPYRRADILDALSMGPDTAATLALCRERMLAGQPLVERTRAFSTAWDLVKDQTSDRVELVLSCFNDPLDPGLAAAASEAIMGVEELKNTENNALKTALIRARPLLDLPRDLEADRLMLGALAHLSGGQEPTFTPPQRVPPLDLEALSWLAQGTRYRITTNQGDIVLSLDVDAAPASCLLFDSLVTAGYYNGKTFHRIVPGFVAQGGCPRGDGWGSLDRLLRTEIGLTGFRTGSVGLASAGRDTESCQFFIMLGPAPHLDGRYTRFAEVATGMDVAWKLGVGDVIERMDKME